LFSSKTTQSVWSIDAFRQLFTICENHSVEFFSYTYSTASRAALLIAGFFVAAGKATGTRAETTIALTPKAVSELTPRKLLGHDWLEKWSRSQAPFPSDTSADEIPALEKIIREHPQFQN